MTIQINQELCAGCGICADACSREAIHLVDNHAEIDQDRCTQCQECIQICPNGAISAIPEPVSITPVMALPAAETRITPVSTPVTVQVREKPVSGLATLAGTVLAYMGSQVAPRLLDTMTNALERRLAQPKMSPALTPTTPATPFMAHNKSRGRHLRYRGGRAGSRNHRGRR